MRKGSKLIIVEFNRMSTLYMTLLAVMAISQLTGFFIMSKGYMSNVNHYIQSYGFHLDEIRETIGIFSSGQVVQSFWVMVPLSILMAFVGAYVFLIWYRDWYGPTTFIYRLFMLPVKRVYVLIGKAMTILLMIFGVIALQLALLYVGKLIIQWNVPIDLRASHSIMDMVHEFNYLAIFFPFTPVTLFTLILTLFVGITILFTAILFERSFAKKGILLGVSYVIGAFIVLMLPELIEIIIGRSFAYPIEMFYLQAGLLVIVGYVSIWMSSYLLSNKVTV